MAPDTQPNGASVPPPPMVPPPPRFVPPAPRPQFEDLARRTVVVVLTTALLLAVIYMFWRGAHVLLMAFAGVLFGLFLSAISDWLTRKTRLPHSASLTMVVVLFFALVGGLLWLMASRVSSQVGALAEKLPQSLQHVREYLSQYPWGRLLLEQVPKGGVPHLELDRFSEWTGLISGVAGFAVGVIVILFVGIFGAAEPDMYREGLAHLFPPANRRRLSEALQALAVNLRWWLVGQFVLMAMIGVTTIIGLSLIRIPEALTLGLLAGLMEAIPYIGPWISFVPTAMVALLISPWHLLMVVLLYLGIHILEAYLLAPLIQRKAVLLPPALGLVAQILLGEVLGFLGLLVAAPLTIAIVVLVKMLYIEDTLGDEDVDVPGEPGNEEKAQVQEEKKQLVKA